MVIMGGGLSLIHNNVEKAQLRNFSIIASIVFVAFSIFSTQVDTERREVGGGVSFADNFSNPILKGMSGIIQYSTAHYTGYQYRRVDYVDKDNLLSS